MPEPAPYKQTLFDREGPDAGIKVKAYAYGAMAGGVSAGVFMLLGVAYSLSPLMFVLMMIVMPVTLSWVVARMAIWLMDRTGEGVHAVLAGSDSTPYVQQNSYQQTLVMQGRLDEALESLEAVIAEPESPVDVRIRAAELYTREAARHDRAAELFREAIRHPKCTAGEEVYSANRLVDLYTGPLQQPGRALVELGRLVDRYPNSVVAERARAALRSLKALQAERMGNG